jgi:diguanylate cyclase (GGDEF)-like protein
MLDVLQTVDVGLVVMDSDYRISAWNGFMENHSGKNASEVKDQIIFDVFAEIPEKWFRHKVDSVRTLNIRAFTTWEQRPYVFKFRNYHPITSTAPFMYQNTTIIPINSSSGEIEQIAMIVYDVTDMATSKLGLEDANKELERLSQTDALTGLFNRGHWETLVNSEYKRYIRHQTPTTMVMFDIDHFKRINDNYGHPAGDEVIRQTASTLLQTVRETDFCGRYGGEEFGIVLVNTDLSQAMYLAERLRKKIAALKVKTEAGVIEFTVSLGVAQLDQTTNDTTKWITHADEALYRSKEGGRNQVSAHDTV